MTSECTHAFNDSKTIIGVLLKIPKSTPTTPLSTVDFQQVIQNVDPKSEDLKSIANVMDLEKRK